jgi:hypothetical protein
LARMFAKSIGSIISASGRGVEMAADTMVPDAVGADSGNRPLALLLACVVAIARGPPLVPRDHHG